MSAFAASVLHATLTSPSSQRRREAHLGLLPEPRVILWDPWTLVDVLPVLVIRSARRSLFCTMIPRTPHYPRTLFSDLARYKDSSVQPSVPCPVSSERKGSGKCVRLESVAEPGGAPPTLALTITPRGRDATWHLDNNPPLRSQSLVCMVKETRPRAPWKRR